MDLTPIQSRLLSQLTTAEDIVRQGSEASPTFYIDTPEGELFLVLDAPADPAAQAKGAEYIKAFMTWRMATRFIVTAELIEPDALFSYWVSRDDEFGVMKLITRDPLSFGTPQWLGSESLDPAVRALLPVGQTDLGEVAVENLEIIFGAYDRIPPGSPILLRISADGRNEVSVRDVDTV